VSDLSANEIQRPATFKIRGQLFILFVVVLSVLAMEWLESIVINKSDGHGPALFLMLAMLVISLLGANAAALGSDVVIDDSGISRKFLGIAWRKIQWDNVQIIKTRKNLESGFRSRQVRGFYVMPSKRSGGISYMSGSIMFPEKFENMDQLLVLLNYYIGKYSIKIETTANGITTSNTSL